VTKQYDNTNRGVFFKNDRKETDKHPDWTGTLNVDGVEYWLSGWKRKPDAAANAPLVSFSVKRKEGGTKTMPKSKMADVQPRSDKREMDDEIPF
jgi:hypothetical protein